MPLPPVSDKVYHSKRDTWLVVILSLAGVLSLSVAGVGIYEDPGSGSVVLVLLLAGVAFVVWLFRATFYVLTATDLVIRSGPFRWTVPLGRIQQVQPSRNPLSSPALSLDRLEVRYTSGFLLISPEDKRAFVEDLVARTPGLLLEGDRAVRRRQF